MHMQSYYIQYPHMYPNHALLQRLIVASNNPVKQDVDCSKENEKSKKQDSKYLQPRWYPLGLTHTQKRGCNVCAKRNQWSNKWRLRRRGQLIGRRYGGRNKLLQHQLKQDMADNCLSPLTQKMADVMLIIVLRQFWLRRIFFGKQALPKNRGADVDSQNWHRPV